LQTISEQPYNAETPLPALLDEVTDSELVYVRNHFEVPKIEVTEWALEVGGSISAPQTFSYAELKALPSKVLRMTLECAGNGRKSMVPPPAGTRWGYGAVSVVEFTGTPVVNVLDKVGVSEQAAEVVFHGADEGKVMPGRTEPFVRSLPLEIAQNSDSILAWEMNGEPLTANHGFPLRLVVPGWYGMASVKWLHKIEVAPEKFSGFFQVEHYVYTEEVGTPEGEPVRHIRVRSLILESTDRAGGKQVIAGIAWSGEGAISKVEISWDGGKSWREAELDPPASRFDVQRWRFLWEPAEGEQFTIVSRATDTAGNIQPVADRWNRLGYGNNGLHSQMI
jgi:DMSO/TMAO reductase YedYZ molybdopterin-dependent catalytic subunit